jgi:hypothetical protein
MVDRRAFAAVLCSWREHWRRGMRSMMNEAWGWPRWTTGGQKGDFCGCWRAGEEARRSVGQSERLAVSASAKPAVLFEE